MEGADRHWCAAQGGRGSDPRTLLATLSACGTSAPRSRPRIGAARTPPRRPAPASRASGTASTGGSPPTPAQVVAVYGEGHDSAASRVVLYTGRNTLASDWRLARPQRAQRLDHAAPRGRRTQPGRRVRTLTDARWVLADRAPGYLRPPTRRLRTPGRVGRGASARLRLRHRHRLQPRQGTPPRDCHPPLGHGQRRGHLVTHGPRQRHLRPASASPRGP